MDRLVEIKVAGEDPSQEVHVDIKLRDLLLTPGSVHRDQYMLALGKGLVVIYDKLEAMGRQEQAYCECENCAEPVYIEGKYCESCAEANAEFPPCKTCGKESREGYDYCEQCRKAYNAGKKLDRENFLSRNNLDLNDPFE